MLRPLASQDNSGRWTAGKIVTDSCTEVGISGIPRKLIPLRFRLATAKDNRVIAGLIFTYTILSALSIGSFALYSGTKLLTFAVTIKILGVVGDSFALAILFISVSVDHYSQKTYVEGYLANAKRCYPNHSEQEVQVMLKEFHGFLRTATGSVLKSDIGASLTALSTVLVFLGDFAK
jgi:hypothetical protein